MSLVFPHTFVPWFRAVAPYIHAYRGKSFVVALAGEAIAAGKLSAFVQDLAILHAMGIKIVLVHGFRPQVTEQLAAKGHVSRFVRGIRVTDAVALDAAQEAAGQLRFEIEAAFSQGLPNTPMANSTVRVVSGNFLTARPVGIVDGVDFMNSGLVRRVDQVAIRRAIESGALVLLSPFGFSPTGEAFNLTMEEVATSTAIALGADKLVFMTEIPGIHERADDAESAIDTELSLAEAKRLLAALPSPTQPSDTAFYLQHCVKACEGGVERSHILPFATDGALLLEVFTHDGIIFGCAALYAYPEARTGEMAALTVSPLSQSQGDGERLLKRIEQRARLAGLESIFVLTTRTMHWFIKRGFVAVDTEWLPEARKRKYNADRRSQVLVKKLV